MSEEEVVDLADKALREWSYWVRGGRVVDGFPRCNVLHKSWMPPAPGVRPMMSVSRARDDSMQRVVHQALGMLSVKLANTVVVHYCYRLSVADQCSKLGCAPSTLHHRLQAVREVVSARLRAGGFTN